MAHGVSGTRDVVASWLVQTLEWPLLSRQLGGLTQQEWTPLHPPSCRQDFQTHGVDMMSLEALGEDLPCVSQRLGAPGGPWIVAAPLQPLPPLPGVPSRVPSSHEDTCHWM